MKRHIILLPFMYSSPEPDIVVCAVPNEELEMENLIRSMKESINSIEVPVISSPSGMSRRQYRKHEATRKRKGRK